MPQVEWNEKNEMPVMLFFPAVGAVLGLLSVGLLLLCRKFGIGEMPAALLLMALHIFYSGGIHLDGLVDTADARHSYLGKDERQRILADPHVGAFGVIRLALYLMVMAALLLMALHSIPAEVTMKLALSIPVTGRVLAMLAVTWMKPARQEGLFYTFSGEKHGFPLKLASVAETAVLALWMFYDLHFIGAVMLCYYVILFFFVKKISIRDFGGMSGDLTGWLLCMAEIGAVAVGAVFGTAGLL